MCVASSTVVQRPSCDCGMRSALTCCARSTTSPSRTARTCERSRGREGRYDEAELENVYTGNDARARIVLKQLRDKIADVGADARARVLRQRRSRRVHGRRSSTTPASRRAPSAATTPHDERDQRFADLRARRVNVAVHRRPLQRGPRRPRRRHGAVPAADRERHGLPAAAGPRPATDPGQGGADGAGLRRVPPQGVPLRPASSAPDRDSRRALERAGQGGLPFPAVGMPDRDGSADAGLVLDNIRSQIANRWAQIVAELRGARRARPRRLPRESGMELSDILRRGSHSWTRLRRDAGLPTPPGSELEEKLLKRVRAFAHVDDPQRATAYHGSSARRRSDYAELSPAEQRMARMLYYSLWSDGGGYASYRGWTRGACARGRNAREISAVVDLSLRGRRHVTARSRRALADVPLKVHARYQREEILGCARLPTEPQQLPRGSLVLARPQRRRLLHHAEEVRGRLLPHDDVRRLPDLARAVPLGVAVDDVGRRHRPVSAISRDRAPC